MKLDKLDQFIADNRADFDTEIPSLKVWAKIDKAINEENHSESNKRIVGLWHYSRIAVAATILLLAGAFIGNYYNQSPQTNAVVAETILPEYAEMETYFKQQVDQKIVQLASYKHDDQALFEDLKQLDDSMEELKEELQNVPKGKGEMVINAMIQNYQTKLMILERVLERIQSSNQVKRKKDGIKI